MKTRKTRLLLLSMVLALILVMQLALPGIVQAATPPKVTKFTGSGPISGQMPAPIPLAPNLLLFQGEVVTGTIAVSSWGDLVGAVLDSVHTSIVTVNWATGDVQGLMRGTFTLTAAGGVVSGTMTAVQKGNLFGDIVSQGVWRATERSGIFEQMLPAGKWQAIAYPPDETGAFTGTFTWSGSRQASGA